MHIAETGCYQLFAVALPVCYPLTDKHMRCVISDGDPAVVPAVQLGDALDVDSRIEVACPARISPVDVDGGPVGEVDSASLAGGFDFGSDGLRPRGDGVPVIRP